MAKPLTQEQDGELITSSNDNQQITTSNYRPIVADAVNSINSSAYDASTTSPSHATVDHNNNTASNFKDAVTVNSSLKRPFIRYNNTSTRDNVTGTANNVRRSSSEMSHWRNRLNSKTSSSSRPNTDMDITRTSTDDVTQPSTTSNNVSSLSDDFKSMKGTQLSASNEVFLHDIRNIARRRQLLDPAAANATGISSQLQPLTGEIGHSTGSELAHHATTAALGQQNNQLPQQSNTPVERQPTAENQPIKPSDDEKAQLKTVDRKLTPTTSFTPSETRSPTTKQPKQSATKRWLISSTEEVARNQHQHVRISTETLLPSLSSVSKVIPQKSSQTNWEESSSHMRKENDAQSPAAVPVGRTINGKTRRLQIISPEPLLVHRKPATRPSLAVTPIGGDLPLTSLRTGPVRAEGTSGVRRQSHVTTPSKIPTLVDLAGNRDDVIGSWQPPDSGATSSYRYGNALNPTSYTGNTGLLAVGHQLYNPVRTSASIAAGTWRTSSPRRSRLPVLIAAVPRQHVAAHDGGHEASGMTMWANHQIGHDSARIAEYRMHQMETTTPGDVNVGYGNFVHSSLDSMHRYHNNVAHTTKISDVDLLDNFDQLSTGYRQPLTVIPPITHASNSSSPRSASASSNRAAGVLSAGGQHSTASRPATAVFKSALRKSSARNSANRKRKRVHFEPTLEMVRIVSKIEYPWNVRDSDSSRVPATNWSYHYDYHTPQF